MPVVVIFKVYDSDCNGKVTFNDVLDVLHDLTGSFISEHQRQVCVEHFLLPISVINVSLCLLYVHRSACSGKVTWKHTIKKKEDGRV